MEVLAAPIAKLIGNRSQRNGADQGVNPNCQRAAFSTLRRGELFGGMTAFQILVASSKPCDQRLGPGEPKVSKQD